ncbi:pRL2-8 [Streptomyces ipomoeae]|uniref:pRL2-8 n=1 Tax=Streptomyces ipomoeae TaxID=103232 RepID=UPI0029A90961|nr:pRL2-8 [Streptomyces ipomoeae]MDX2698926.1 pRL2-8 [Streptomyces ipomoeae]MDX2844568.1 pRL2-8 [Streptomyces ipomoeae]
MAKSLETPPGECRQCWQHAYDRKIHRKLKPREDCGPCVDHMKNGCGDMIVPKKESIWW